MSLYDEMGLVEWFCYMLLGEYELMTADWDWCERKIQERMNEAISED